MLRAALVAAAVLALAVPAALSFVAAEDPAGHDAATEPLPWSHLHFSDDAMPDETGWFLVPVTVDQPAYVRFATDIFAGGSSERTAWSPLLVVEQAYQPPALGFGTSQKGALAEVAHDGAATRCCADLWTGYSYMWGEGPEMVMLLSPGQVVWFGMAASEWSDHDDLWFEVSGQAVITLGEPRTGERVEAVDLYDDAMRAGTRAQLFGSDVVALPGDATHEWTSEGYGVLTLDAYGWSDGRATLTLEIPGENTLAVPLGPDGGVYASAHRAGTYRVTLSDIEPPLAQPYVLGAPWMQARALFADIDVPGDVAIVHVWPEQQG